MSDSQQNPFQAVGLALGVAALLIVPVAVFLYLRSSGFDVGLGTGADETTASTPAGDRPSPASAAKPKRAYPEFDVETPAPARPTAAAPDKAPTVVQAAPKPADRKFPTPADVPAGMEKSALILKFGRPSMSTTEVNQGRTLETFHYLRPDTGTEVVVLLSAGKVLTSAAITY